MSKRMCGVAVLAAVFVMALGSLAVAAPLDGSTSLNSGTNAIPLLSGAQNVTANASGVYDWNDKNGDGTPGDAVAPAGMDMQGFTLSTTNGSHIELNLNGGDITGTNATSLSTAAGTSGNISVLNVGAISMGGMSTATTSSGHNTRGYITIGEVGTPAGSVRVNYLDVSHNGAGCGEFDVGATLSVLGVTVHSNGDVRIQDSDNDGTANLGDILGYSTNGGYMGTIDIQHQGTFRARNLDTHMTANWPGHGSYRADITATGNVVAAASGTFLANNIDTSFGSSGNYNNAPNRGDVTISGYTGVQVTGDIDTYTNRSGTPGGSVSITGVTGDITLDGTLNLTGSGGTDNTYNGALTLACDGTITLEQGLDLSKMLYASFDSGPATAEILGAILGSDGNPADGATIGNLRTPSGDVIYYDPAENPDLLGGTYDLADLGGTPGAGGLLKPFGGDTIPEPAGLALFGLALVGLKKRKRS